jgi:hypothetical protein
MSGVMQFRVNKVWEDSVQNSIGIARFFAEMLAFFADHLEFDIISYGTGKSETGTSTPTSWKTWADSDGSGTVPFSDNSWFVVEAQNASASLNGDGSRQWQAKFQFTSTTGFDDCNYADVEYGSGTEGTYHRLMVRFSPDGGWVAGTTLDFTSVTASDNLQIADADFNDSRVDFGLHMIGDDDTIIWVAQLMTYGGTLPTYSLQRFGYLGETVRRNSNHTKPELAIVGTAIYNAGYVLGREWDEPSTRIFNSPQQGSNIPSFSLDSDGNVVDKHMFWCGHNTTGADSDILFTGADDPWTSETEYIGILVRHDDGEHNSIIGQLRIIEIADSYKSEGNLWGDGTRLSVGYQTSTKGGLAVPWPGSGTSPLF